MARSSNTDFRRIQDQQGDTKEISPWGYDYAEKAVQRRVHIDREYFVCYQWDSVGAGSTVTLSIMTNGKFPHGTFTIEAESELSYDIQLSTTTLQPAGSTQVYPHNLNRGCNHTRAVATFYRDTTSGDISKTIENGRTSIKKVSSDAVSAYWLLDSGRVYHIRIKNEDSSAKYVIIKYSWHEHTPIEAEGTGEDENEYDYEPV